MALVLRSPYRSLWRHFGYPQGWYAGSAWPVNEGLREVWSPKIMVANGKEHVTFHIDLPGVKPEDVDVSVGDGIITFNAEKQAEHSVEREGYEYRETSTCSFSRSIPLPDKTDWEKAEATFEEGALEVTIPRAEPEEPRHIPVHTASAGETVEPAGPGAGSEATPAGGQESARE